MTPVRIAQVCADRGIAPGGTKGASQHLRGIAQGVQQLGHHVTTFCSRPAEGDFPVDLRPLDLLAEEVHRFDVVYERSSLGHTDGLDLARANGLPFVLEVNAPLFEEARRHRPDTVAAGDEAAERRLVADADLVITVSSELADWARRVRTGPVRVLPNGFAPDWFRTPPRTEPSFPLVFLGHPKPWHGADRLVPLLMALADRGHRPRTLVIGGGEGAERLRETARRHGLADQLVVTGAVPGPEASRLLADAAIGLAPYPSQRPFYFCPLKVIDYLAAGLAVVSTAQGDVPDLVGDAGIVVDPDDDEALSDAVALLLDRLAEARRRGAVGRRRAFTSMTWTHVAARTIEAISALVPAGASR